VVGSEVYHQAQGGGGEFRFDPGPIFGNLILVDEINRAPAKVQSALLEAMEERQVTVAGTTHGLPPLFMVMATQNPIEQEGTYPLPEAQLDRFLMHVKVDYPPDADERAILRLVRDEERAARSGAPAEAPMPIPRRPSSPRAPRWWPCTWRTRSTTMSSPGLRHAATGRLRCRSRQMDRGGIQPTRFHRP
jgi:MoxR-like ATPase